MARRGVFGSRMRRLSKGMAKAGLRGVVLVPGPNVRYLTGVQSLLMERPFMLLVPAEGTPQLVAPTLEAGPYRSAEVELDIYDWRDSAGPSDAIGKAVKEVSMNGRWGVEGRAPYLFLSRLLKQASPTLEDVEPLLQGLREVKDGEEIRLLREAARILSLSFEHFPDVARAGMTEAELARKVTDLAYSNRATRVDDVLVQSGPRAADPHSQPSQRRIGRGESLVVDISSTFEGYYADITRTFCLGQSKELERVYGEVLAAQEEAIGAAEKGVAVGEVDAAARDHLARLGLGGYFTHRTGHGLGLEGHEAPYIVEGGREKLAPGMFFTVEPGVYIAGELGVRIEDDVMIRGRKGATITDPPKEYGWWR